MQAEGATPFVEQAEQQERGPRQRGVPRRQVLAEGRHGTGRASEQRDRGRAGDYLSAGSAGETGRIARRRARAGPAARERPPARAAAPSPPRTRASRARARARGRSKGSSPGKTLRTRGPRWTLGERGGATRRILSAGPGLPPLLASSACTHPSFHKNWKIGPGLRGGFSGPCPSAIPWMGWYHPLKETGERGGTAPSLAVLALARLEAQCHLQFRVGRPGKKDCRSTILFPAAVDCDL